MQKAIVKKIDEPILCDGVSLRPALRILNDIYGLADENLGRGFEKRHIAEFGDGASVVGARLDPDQGEVKRFVVIEKSVCVDLENDPCLDPAIRFLVEEICPGAYRVGLGWKDVMVRKDQIRGNEKASRNSYRLGSGPT